MDFTQCKGEYDTRNEVVVFCFGLVWHQSYSYCDWVYPLEIRVLFFYGEDEGKKLLAILVFCNLIKFSFRIVLVVKLIVNLKNMMVQMVSQP